VRAREFGGRHLETVNGPDGVSDSAGSTGRAIAASAVLICAALLMVCPAIVAAISMVDLDALTNLSRRLERLAPMISYVDHAKWALTLSAPVLLWRAETKSALEPSLKRLRQLQIRRRPSSLA
jgi:hypothetical protein